MAVVNGVIVAPVEIADLQRLVGVMIQRTVSGVTERRNSGDLGVLAGSSVGDTIPDNEGGTPWTVVSRSEINKWARYKPERADGFKPLIHGDQIGGVRTRKGNNFGLEIPYCIYDPQMLWYRNVMNGIVSDIMNGNFIGWNYLKPRGDRTQYQGGVKEYYRLTDFVRLPNDDTDPYYGTVYAKGYNSNAKIPVVSWIGREGIRQKADGTYEVNRQVANYITIYFQNSVGDDLHLQDFITLGTDTQGRAWRPVLQLFKDGIDPVYHEDWDIRDHADMEVCGEPFTADQGNTLWKVTLDLSSFTPDAVTKWHLCVGIGLVNSDFSHWGDGNALFILPYSQLEASEGKYPFHYVFTVASHQERKLKVTRLQFVNFATGQWQEARGTAPTFSIHTEATNVIGIVLTITKLEDQQVTFVKYTDLPSDYMHIFASEMIDGSLRNIIYLTPSVGPNPPGSQAPWAEDLDGITVPIGPETETVTLYAKMNIGNIPLGGYGEYNLTADTGAGLMDDIGYFSIHKIPYF